MAFTLDLVGGSSYIWQWKHARYHHTYVNIAQHDSDIDLGVLGRLSPEQPRRPWHRWQHIYLWVLYSVTAIRWHLYGDFRDMLTGRIGDRPFERPRGWDLALFVLGKAGLLHARLRAAADAAPARHGAAVLRRRVRLWPASCWRSCSSWRM